MRARWERAAVALALLLFAAFCVGCGSEEKEPDRAEAALQAYESRLEEEVAILRHWIVRMREKVEAGLTLRAQSHYATARVPFGHLKPLATAYPSVNARLDAWADQVPKGERWTGFHRVEYLLWTRQDPGPRLRAIKQLLLDARRLEEVARSKSLTPAQIAGSINEVMAGTITRTLTGDAEPNAQIDLLDLSATMEGVEAAFEAIAPMVLEVRPRLVKRIRTAFDGIYAEVRAFGTPAREPEQARAGSPGVSFVSYPDADPELVNQLRWQINELNTSLAKLPAAVDEAESVVAGSDP
jgi:iron uptake system component EfeO